MKTKLKLTETAAVASLLFGLFFGAGNLIFPVHLGQSAGARVGIAAIGFLVTGVGIPLLGVAALGMSKSRDLLEMSSRTGRKYGIFFTCLLYLTIGPFFAIPRCASTSFSVGIAPMIENEHTAKYLLWLFSFLFFAVVLFFSLRPGKILTYVGKILTPLFLISLGILIVSALLHPIGNYQAVEPEEAYAKMPLFKGILEGYNTMDALAGLAFGIVVIKVIRDLGVKEPGAVAACTLKSGIFGCSVMAVIYVALMLIGAQSRAVYPVSADGGEALHLIAHHYFGDVGAIILAVIVTLACLKTAVGLITSCSETFCTIFPAGPSYKIWTTGFCIFSFFVATMGLASIITYSVPVLMFLYPLAITLILLALSGNLFQHNRTVYVITTLFTMVAAVFDFMNALPAQWREVAVAKNIAFLGNMLPFSQYGLGWICPALLGFLTGFCAYRIKEHKRRVEKNLK